MQKSLGADERGGPMLEFALILPIVVLLFFGIVQYGMIFSAFISLRNAASVAARRVALLGAPPSGTLRDSAATDAATAALNGILPASNLDGAVVTDVGGLKKVQLTYHYPTMFRIPGAASDGRFTLVAEAAME